jgi:protein-S-isoprenylcysteine O-methyltransferase Ste14
MEIINENITAILILSVNLAATMSYIIIYSKESFKNIFFRLPVLLQKLYVLFFVAPLFIAPFFAESKFSDSCIFMVLSGTAFTLLGFLIILMSFLKIGVIPSIKSDGKLSTTGTYKIVRHPIYFGTILAQLGFILLNQSTIPLIYLPFSIVLYYIMATIEEKDLIIVFGDQYLEFRSKTKGKVIPYFF